MSAVASNTDGRRLIVAGSPALLPTWASRARHRLPSLYAHFPVMSGEHLSAREFPAKSLGLAVSD